MIRQALTQPDNNLTIYFGDTLAYPKFCDPWCSVSSLLKHDLEFGPIFGHPADTCLNDVPLFAGHFVVSVSVRSPFQFSFRDYIFNGTRRPEKRSLENIDHHWIERML